MILLLYAYNRGLSPLLSVVIKYYVYTILLTILFIFVNMYSVTYNVTITLIVKHWSMLGNTPPDHEHYFGITLTIQSIHTLNSRLRRFKADMMGYSVIPADLRATVSQQLMVHVLLYEQKRF